MTVAARIKHWPKPFEAARATDVQEGFKSPWSIEKRTPDVNYGGSLGAVFRTGRGVLRPGQTITMLRRHGTLVMSDTPDEIGDLSPIFRAARGRVLVHGLGLGCVLRGLLAIEAVEHIDVVEISPELIELMGPYFADEERVTIHQGDCLTFDWPKGTRWDCVWHDVWDNLCTGNLRKGSEADPFSYEEMHRKFGRRCNWQGSWGFDFLKAHDR